MTLEELKQLRIGDVVKLNSSSVKMTVDVIENNLVSCVVWHDAEFRVARAISNIDYALLTVYKN